MAYVHTLRSWRNRIATFQQLINNMTKTIAQVRGIESIASRNVDGLSSIDWPIDDEANQYMPTLSEISGEIELLAGETNTEETCKYAYVIEPGHPHAFNAVKFALSVHGTNSSPTLIISNAGTPFTKCKIGETVRIEATWPYGGVSVSTEATYVIAANDGGASITLASQIPSGVSSPPGGGASWFTNFKMTLVNTTAVASTTQFTITTQVTGSGICSALPPVVDVGKTSNITAYPLSGNHLVVIHDEADGDKTEDYITSPIYQNRIITAVFSGGAGPTYEITTAVDCTEEGAVCVATPASVVQGSTCVITVTGVPTGYHVDHFVDSVEGTLSGISTYITTPIISARTITAYLKTDSVGTHTLTYSAGANGSITSGTSPQTVADGASGTAVTATGSTGYHFDHWEPGGSTQNPRTDTNVKTDITVAAVFSNSTVTLMYMAGSHGTIVGVSSQTINYGATGTTVTATPAANYEFVKWSDTNSTNPVRQDTNVTTNITATASFQVKSTKDIANQTDLAKIGVDPDYPLSGSYVVTADIVMNATHTPIGGSSTKFTGTFDGQNHLIFGMTVNTATTGAGLFGWIGASGLVKNVTVSGASVTCTAVNGAAGCLAGYNEGAITNVACSCNVMAGFGNAFAGGIVGLNGGAVIGCSAAGRVLGSGYGGGVVGMNTAGVSKSSTACRITGGVVGGFVGANAVAGTISDCYAYGGSVNGAALAAGFVASNGGIVTRCYCVTYGISSDAGFCAIGTRYVDRSCTFDWQVEQVTPDSGWPNAVGGDTDQCKTVVWYTGSGWDFTNVWTISAGNYPQLRTIA